MSLYHEGDRVRIVSAKGSGRHWNPEGGMDHWLGSVMTIRKVVEGCKYKMVEDRNEWGGDGWVWHDFMIVGLAEDLPTSFTKKDLQNGDVVQMRNGYKYIVLFEAGTHKSNMLKRVCSESECGWNLLDEWSDGLKFKEGEEWDIMKVWRMRHGNANIFGEPDDGDMEVVFDRDAVKHIGLTEAIRILSEKVGCNVVIQG